MTARLIGGRYLLGEPLGSGGMGSVWRAHDQQLDRTVALKRAHPGVDDQDGRRLRREARTGARLHDPHVVMIFDVVSDGDEHWLVLEYLPSRSSLAHVDACTLLDSKALKLIPGVDASQPDRSFGNSRCGWDSTTSDLSADLYFDRDQPGSTDRQPLRIGGRSAILSNENDGPGTCAVVIVFRTYVDANGQDELVTMSVAGSAKPVTLCGLATKLAEAAAPKLPKA
ncbi:hypothetical protein JOF29_005947 [Kribbella aluminosa]|uniref:non-specific serine/threonine protein kinase n=1 Tax=Kribbella aluminosa TaxID=416017 RepID=A0ABS4UT61_9ACTN|nr:DUF3558 family protein [Kribbella aluminosa]MBP2354837.1 hypothetical protein [Kribbella aluminosa]